MQSRARSGIKSCAECRRRKVRCIWPSAASAACDHCDKFGKECVPPAQATPGSARRDVARTTSTRERVQQLERDMKALSRLVGASQNGTGTSAGVNQRDAGRSVDESFEESQESPDLDNAEPPLHLKLLFDHVGAEEQQVKSRTPALSRATHDLMAESRTRLQQLLPSREDVSHLSCYATAWMSLSHTLFPAFFAFETGDQLLQAYDRMYDSRVSPITLSTYLLSIAVTSQQVPQETVPLALDGGRSGVNGYVDRVCRAVKLAVVDKDVLAGTVEGLEMTMLYIRLSIGRGDPKTAWLTLRRAIGLAELIGLPHATQVAQPRGSVTPPVAAPSAGNREEPSVKAEVWDAICATDRNFSMMLNLPVGTARYSFPLNPSVFRDGQLSARAYNYRLSVVCAMVYEIDEAYARRPSSDAEKYELVLRADRELRALAASAPSSWRQSEDEGPLADLLVKFWHAYISARVHLRPAMLGGGTDVDEYAHSRVSCWNACLEAVRRFPLFREKVPAGFFVCRMLDVQVFTAMTFILLSSQTWPLLRSQQPQVNGNRNTIDATTKRLVDRVVECFESLRGQPGSDFAQEAAETTKSLIAIMQGQKNAGSGALKLQIPMLGRIAINVPSQAQQFGGTATSNTKSWHGAGQSSNFSQPFSLGGAGDGLIHPPVGLTTSASEQPDVLVQPAVWSFELDTTALWP